MEYKTFFKNKKYSLAEQKAALCLSFPHSECSINKGRLHWTAAIKPTNLSREYNAEILYQVSKPPEVYVFGDELQGLDREGFPHNYGVDVENKRVKICLYRHKEFYSDKLLCDTIVPWIAEWLYFYEIWLATGEWQGGGETPDIEKIIHKVSRYCA